MPRRIRLLKRAPLSALNKAVLPLPPAPTPLFSFVNFFHPFAPLSILTFFQFVEAHGLQINRWVRTISERS